MENKSRIQYLDFARGFAVLTMFLQHCMIIHDKSAGEGTILGIVFLLLGTAPAAPVFMLIMGVFLGKSEKSVRHHIKRGLKLILLGYILNLLRFAVPLVIAGGNELHYAKHETPMAMLLSVDIFQLAGLSIIAGALIKEYVQYIIIYPLLILTILLASPFLWGFHDNFYPFAVLWGTGKNIFFPFFPWFIYPLLGLYFSEFLLDKNTFIKEKKSLILFPLTLLSAGILFTAFEVFPTGDYYRSGMGVHLIIIGFIGLWLFLSYFLAVKLKKRKSRFFETMIFWSSNVTAVYFIQWVLFGWSILFLGANGLEDYQAALAGAAVLVITHGLVKLTNISNLFTWFTK